MRTSTAVLLAVLLCALGAADARAQDAASVNWLLTTDQEPSATEGLITGLSLTGGNMVVRDYTGTLTGSLAGPLGTYQRWWLDNQAWPDDSAPVMDRFVQFAVEPAPGVLLDLDSLSLYLNAGGTGNMHASLYYATDAEFASPILLEADMAVSRDAAILHRYALEGTLGQGERVYFRVYPFLPGGGSAGKYLFLQNITVYGNTTASAFPAAATWALNSQSGRRPSTAGNVLADSQQVSSDFIIRDYAAPEGSERVYSAGGGLGFWPADTVQNDARYTTFAMYPRRGVTFRSDSVTMYLGNGGGSYLLRANVYYSTDGFESAVRLDSGIVIPNSAVQRYAYAVSETLTGEDTLSVRVYPWLQGGVAAGKYFGIKDVVISGEAEGAVAADPPVVTTSPVSRISTLTAQSGGTVSSDGGAPVIARGVVWSDSPTPTLSNAKTMDGEGSGLFVSALTGLSPGTLYYVRAYATNTSGTSYGEQTAFATLARLSPPEVATTAVSDVLTTRATTGGTVTFDGGLDVAGRGIVWNASGGPTVLDNKEEAGAGLGAFKVTLAGLSPETTYYARAYASNAEGTSYGNEIAFTTAAPADPIHITVAKDGSGDFTSVQEAFNAVPDNYTGSVTVFVKKGTYKEKVVLGQNKINVRLIGESRDSTILTWDDYSGKVVDGVTIGTSTSYSVAIDASDFYASDITFENTADQAQAVALRVNGDRMAFYRVNMLGNQDTYYTWYGGRLYHKDCYIEGTVDFIFGRAIAVFDDCTLHSKRNSTITAASTEAGYRFGYVFRNATLTADPGITQVHLGRPWRENAQTVFIDSDLGSHVRPEGWSEWAGNANHLTAYYAEYNNRGASWLPESRVPWAHILTNEEAARYSLENIFAKDSGPAGMFGIGWMPQDLVVGVETGGASELPARFELFQNYPNPFGLTTTISYALPTPGAVRLAIHNVLGQEVALLVDGEQPAGRHEVALDGRSLAAGVYFYTMEAGSFRQSGKMLVVR